MKLVRGGIVVMLLAVLSAFGFACGGDDAETAATPAAGVDSPATVGVAEVEMKDISFKPVEVKVKVNGTVRWVNNDPVSHTVTDDADVFDSGVLSGDGTVFEHQYDEPGTYSYTCTIHPTTMKGTVVVEE